MPEHPEPPRWPEVKGLFQHCLDLPAAARSDFLDRACDGDPELRSAVDGLLRAHGAAGSFLEDPPLGGEAAGRRIGPYELQRELGGGGMGAVYLARRHDDYRQEVALKLIHRGMDSDEILRRFRNERQALAGLSHPNIARLLDGGTTDGGLPYLVMELIEGEPIDRYCEARQLSVRDRLRLLLPVCSAVELAHSKGVIHRDLKPANLLVTASGIPKLLDFGIAKILDPRMASTMAPTEGQSGWMTPAYASPEQVRGEAVTAATDVYSTGVLLYRLLTGAGPYAAASPSDLARAIVEDEVVPPSRKVRDRRLRDTLRGDLDTLLLTALAKDPGRRYRSAEALAEDIARYLDGRPLAARPDSAVYRLGKWVRRNRAVTVAMLLACLWALTMTWQRVQIGEQKDRVSYERAGTEAALEFLIEVFDSAVPGPEHGRDLTALEILDRGAVRLGGMEGRPEIQARLLETLGRIYDNVGLYERAQPLLEQAIERHRSLPAGQRAALADSLTHLAKLHFRAGDAAGAEPLHHEALAIRRALGDVSAVASSLNYLALVQLDRGDLEAAEDLLAQALELQRRELGSRHPEVAASLGHQAKVVERRGDARAAIELQRRAVDIYREALWEGSRNRLTATANLAMLLIQAGDYAAAEPLLREAEAGYRNYLGPDHPGRLPILLALGTLLRHQGELEQAAEILRSSLAIGRRALGAEHRETLKILHGLAAVEGARGEIDGALAIYRQLLDVYRAGSQEREEASALNNLAMLLGRQGRFEEAIARMREAVDLRRRSLGGEHPEVADAFNNLGSLLYRAGEGEAAERYFRQALTVGLASRSEDHPNLAFPHLGLARVLLDRRLGEPAREHALRAVTIRRASLRAGHWRTAEAEAVLGECELRLGQPRRAEALLAGSLPILRRAASSTAELASRRAELAVAELDRLAATRQAGTRKAGSR